MRWSIAGNKLQSGGAIAVLGAREEFRGEQQREVYVRKVLNCALSVSFARVNGAVWVKRAEFSLVSNSRTAWISDLKQHVISVLCFTIHVARDKGITFSFR